MNNFNGMSWSDPDRYNKINAVLNEKGKKKDLLDRVETVPLEYVYDLVDDGPSPEDNAILSELKTVTTSRCLDAQSSSTLAVICSRTSCT